MVYLAEPFKYLMSLQEAADIWKLDASTLRKAIARGDLIDGRDVAKFGKQWVITAEAMAKFTETWSPWSIYRAQRRKAELSSDYSE